MGSWPLWIDRATVKENLPPVFKGKYEDTIVIIDCTECQKIPQSSLNFIQNTKVMTLLKA